MPATSHIVDASVQTKNESDQTPLQRSSSFSSQDSTTSDFNTGVRNVNSEMSRNVRKATHTAYDLRVHLAWITKYRYKVLTSDVGHRTRELIRQFCSQNDGFEGPKSMQNQRKSK